MVDKKKKEVVTRICSPSISLMDPIRVFCSLKSEAETTEASEQERSADQAKEESLSKGDGNNQVVDGAGLEPASLESQESASAKLEDNPASSR